MKKIKHHKIIIVKALTVILTVIFSLQLNAQTRTFTLDEAIQTALIHNREIIISKMSVDKADAAVREAFGYALPTVDVSANFSHFLEKPRMPFPDFVSLLGNATYSILFDENVLPRDDNKFKPVETALQSFAQTNNFESSIQITQTLFNSAVFNGIGASKIYSNLSKEDLKRTVAATILNVKKTFYGVILMQRMYDITNASYQNALKNVSNVKAIYEQGMVSEFDLLQAEVRVENIRPVVLQMENSLKNAIDGLKIMLGLPQTEVIDVIGEMKYEPVVIPGYNELISEAIESNYSIKTLNLKKEVDEAFIHLDLSEYWPTLYAFGNYSYSGSSDDFKFQNYSSAIVGVSFQMNLFTGLKTKNRVQQSTIAAKQTEQQLLQLKDYITSQVKSKMLEIKRVESILDAQERNVQLAERAYDISVVRYKEGIGNQLEVQNADIALQQARANRLQSVYEYIIAKAELDELLGKVDNNYLSPFIYED
jgi:outer membrane protein